MSIDLDVAANLPAIATHEAAMLDLHKSLDSWIETANQIRVSAASAWWGDAADAFDTKARDIDKAVVEMKDLLGKYQLAVATFEAAMQSVAADLATIQSEGIAAGLTVVETTIHEPSAPPANSPDVAEHERLLRAFNGLGSRTNRIRSAEARAHNAFQRECENIALPRGWEFVWTAFGWSPEPGAVFFFATENAPDAANLTGIFVMQRFGRFAFREKGKYAKLPEDARTLIKAFDDPKNYQNRPLASATSRWMFGAGKMLRTAGKLSTATMIGFAVYDAWAGASQQWERDSYDPTISPLVRPARTLIEGALDGAIPVAGTLLGAELAGRIGTAVGGSEGGAVGGAAGGVVGSIAGGVLGGAAGTAGAMWTDTLRKGLIDDYIRG